MLGGMGAFLALLTLLTLVMLRVQKHQQRVAVRLGQVTSAYVPRRIDPAGGASLSRVVLEAGPLVRRAAACFGYKPQRSRHYPLSWWVVLPATLILARWLFAALVMSLLGEVGWAVVPLAWIWMSRFFFAYFDNRRTNRLYKQFPDALAMITRAVRVGIPVTESIRTVARESVAPTTEEFQILSDQLTIGVPLEDGLRELSERNSLPEYQFFATALSLQAQTGGGLSETLDNLADVIRKRVALRARAYALASEARTSIIILASLPVVAGGALAVLNPTYIDVLFFDPSGRKVLAMALVSLGTGHHHHEADREEKPVMKAQILLMLGAGLVLFGLTIVVLMQRLQLEERIIARIRHVQREVGIDDIGSGEGGHRFSWRGQVATIGELLMRTGMLSAKTIEELHQNLRIAGFRDRDALGVLIGGKLLLLIGTPFGVWALLRWSGPAHADVTALAVRRRHHRPAGARLRPGLSAPALYPRARARGCRMRWTCW